MKKKLILTVITSLLLVGLILVPVAAATDPAPTTRIAGAAFAERLAIRQELLALRIQILENRQEILTLVGQNNRLRIELKKKLAAERGSLDQDTITKLKGAQVQLKEQMQELRRTQDQIRENNKRIRNHLPKRDFAALKAAYLEIIRIQEARIAKLQAINQLLTDTISWL